MQLAKKIFQIIILICILLVVVAAGIIFLVSPNHYRKEINASILAHTGYPIEVTGPITWSFKPPVTFNLQNLILANPNNPATPIVAVKEANISVQPFSLLGDNLTITRLELKGLTLALDDATSMALPLPNRKAANIKQITIQNSSIGNQHWALNNVTINANNLMSKPTNKLEPINIKGDLTNLEHNFAVNIDTMVNADLEKQTLTLNPLVITSGAVKVTGTGLITQSANGATITGDLDLPDLELLANTETIHGKTSYTYTTDDQTLTFTGFNLQQDEASVKGEIKFSFAKPYNVNFNLNLDKINLYPLLSLPLTNLTPNLDLLKTMDLKGHITGSAVKLRADFLLDNLSIDMLAENSILQINPINVDAYGGSNKASLTINLISDNPTFKITDQSSNIVLEQWLKLLDYPNKPLGTAEAKINLDASGKTMDELMQSANGGINVIIKDGSITGINIDNLIQYAADSISDPNLKTTAWMNTQKNSPVSKFKSLTLKADMQNGVANSSLTMTSDNYDLNGKGSFTLLDSKINGSASVTNKNSNNNLITTTPLSIAISGTIKEPVFSPDMQNYVATINKQSQTVLLKQVATQMVNSSGPSQKTSEAAEDIFISSLRSLEN